VRGCGQDAATILKLGGTKQCFSIRSISDHDGASMKGIAEKIDATK
jgi:hypothetical protein